MKNGYGQIPRHVAIIMDGNGRWAKARGLKRVEGHKEGARAVRHAVETATRLGIEYLTLYAFSVANWTRPASEVAALMQLLIRFAKQERLEMRQNGIRVNAVGRLDQLPLATRHAVESVIKYTAGGNRMTLTLALSYGGRQDILAAAQALAVQVQKGTVAPEQIDEGRFQSALSTYPLPDVDLLIRTGGVQRLSDFLLYEAAYAELMFLPIMWPEFEPQTLIDAVAAFGRRERRFGRTSEQVVANGGFFKPVHQQPQKNEGGQLEIAG